MDNPLVLFIRFMAPYSIAGSAPRKAYIKRIGAFVAKFRLPFIIFRRLYPAASASTIDLCSSTLKTRPLVQYIWMNGVILSSYFLRLSVRTSCIRTDHRRRHISHLRSIIQPPALELTINLPDSHVSSCIFVLSSRQASHSSRVLFWMNRQTEGASFIGSISERLHKPFCAPSRWSYIRSRTGGCHNRKGARHKFPALFGYLLLHGALLRISAKVLLQLRQDWLLHHSIDCCLSGVVRLLSTDSLCNNLFHGFFVAGNYIRHHKNASLNLQW